MWKKAEEVDGCGGIEGVTWRPQIILLHFININKKKLSKRPSDTSTKGLVKQT